MSVSWVQNVETLAVVAKTAQTAFMRLGKRDADFKAYMTAYDKQLTDFTTMF
jgi:hypothetical protein